MKKPTVILATALSTVALAGAIGVGVASADPTTSPSPGTTATAAPTTGSAQPGQQARKHGKRDLAQRALHGEVTLGGKKHRVVDFQRGTVTAVSASSITVKSTDEFTATYAVDAGTKVRHAKEQAAIGDVKTGDKVRVVGVKDGSTVTATRIADRTK